MFDIVTVVISLAVCAIAAAAVMLIQKCIGTEKMKQLAEEIKNKQSIVDTAVLFIQQVYEAADGEAKYAKAVDVATEWLNAKGLSVTNEELQSLIESSVKLMKKEFAEAWTSATAE